MKRLKILWLTVLLVALAGCVSDTEKLRVGMDRAGVVAAMGSPLSVSGGPGYEILNYSLAEASARYTIGRPYQVRLADGKVESFGFSYQLPPVGARGVSAARTAALRVGMTREEAITIMGEPDSASSERGAEFLHFSLSETRGTMIRTRPYLVKLVDGKVDSFGFGAGPIPAHLRP